MHIIKLIISILISLCNLIPKPEPKKSIDDITADEFKRSMQHGQLQLKQQQLKQLIKLNNAKIKLIKAQAKLVESKTPLNKREQELQDDNAKLQERLRLIDQEQDKIFNKN